MGPLNGARSSEMPDRRFGSIVWRLRLWNIHDRPGHAPNEYH